MRGAPGPPCLLRAVRPFVFIAMEVKEKNQIRIFFEESRNVKRSPSEGKTGLNQQNVTEKTNKQDSVAENQLDLQNALADRPGPGSREFGVRVGD